MQYIVIESSHGHATAYIGPFASQCQALSYIESRKDKTNFQYMYRSLLIPEYMPRQIHETATKLEMPPSIKYINAVEKVLQGLSDSDFVSDCGAKTIQELREYKIDMALTLQSELEPATPVPLGELLTDADLEA